MHQEEREEYENRLNWLRIEASAVKRAEERGREERNIEIAKKMLIKKRSIEEIHEITELSIEEIGKLKAEIEA